MKILSLTLLSLTLYTNTNCMNQNPSETSRSSSRESSASRQQYGSHNRNRFYDRYEYLRGLVAGSSLMIGAGAFAAVYAKNKDLLFAIGVGAVSAGCASVIGAFPLARVAEQENTKALVFDMYNE